MYLKVSFLDVYHGDCAVIILEKSSGKSCIVIDGGETLAAAERLSTYLKSEEIEIIDLLIGTHIDADHINGLKYLLDRNSSGDD